MIACDVWRVCACVAANHSANVLLECRYRVRKIRICECGIAVEIRISAVYCVVVRQHISQHRHPAADAELHIPADLCVLMCLSITRNRIAIEIHAVEKKTQTRHDRQRKKYMNLVKNSSAGEVRVDGRESDAWRDRDSD